VPRLKGWGRDDSSLFACSNEAQGGVSQINSYQHGVYIVTAYITDHRLSQCIQDTSVSNWNGVLRVFRYLKGTIDTGITFKGTNSDLEGYSDSDYAAGEDRKSIYGKGFVLSGAIAWSSMKQTTCVGSTMEAEYIALNEAGKEDVFLYEILQTMDPRDRLPITLYEDNQGTVQYAHNPEFHKRSKHIDNRYHYVRQLLEDNIISVEHVSMGQMAADMLTKPLKKPKLEGVGPV
jgi:hypothetical protein